MSRKSQYQRAYGQWAGHPNGDRPDFTRCAHEVIVSLAWAQKHQCKRKCGHGPDGAYCRQHAAQFEASK